MRNASAGSPVQVDPEVVARPRRRKFTAEYKRKILAEADAVAGTGEIASLLRREGLYSSTLSKLAPRTGGGRSRGVFPEAGTRATAQSICGGEPEVAPAE